MRLPVLNGHFLSHLANRRLTQAAIYYESDSDEPSLLDMPELSRAEILHLSGMWQYLAQKRLHQAEMCTSCRLPLPLR